MTNASVIAAIVNGEVDDSLDRIRQAIKDRENTIASVALYTLDVGDRVRLKGLSPKYLNGLTGTIVSRPRGNSKRFGVKLDTPHPRFGSTVRPPVQCVEAVA